MKTSLLLLLLTSFALYSQEKPIAIEYDQSGNRVLRSSMSIETRGASVSNTPGDSLTMSDEVNGFIFELFPNPVEQEVNISTQPEFVQQGSHVLYLYDLTGKLVLQKNFKRAQEKLDLRGVKSGTYVLILRTDGKDVTEWKVVKR
jgi:hypothetical protein